MGNAEGCNLVEWKGKRRHPANGGEKSPGRMAASSKLSFGIGEEAILLSIASWPM
jgi:hypothetical protein